MDGKWSPPEPSSLDLLFVFMNFTNLLRIGSILAPNNMYSVAYTCSEGDTNFIYRSLCLSLDYFWVPDGANLLGIPVNSYRRMQSQTSRPDSTRSKTAIWVRPRDLNAYVAVDAHILKSSSRATLVIRILAN